MDNTKEDFEIRKRETEKYFSFLSTINNEDTRLEYNGKKTRVSNSVQRILIANFFLILYNLIESTIKNSIVEIYEKIEKDEIEYADLSEKLKALWLKQKTKKINKNSVEDIISHILNKEVVCLTKDNINIAGNLDAHKIRKIADDIGFSRVDNGRNLLTIKDKRNKLSHGEQTFYSIGKDFTVKELDGFKEEVIYYLKDVIKNIETFIDLKKYKLREA